MNLSFYGYDFGGMKDLARVASFAAEKNHGVAFFGHCAVDIDLLFMNSPSLVVVSFSTDRTDEIDLLNRATKRGVSAYLLCDSHCTWSKKFAEGLVGYVTAIVATPAEVAMAKAFGYGGAVYLGGPPKWQDFATLPAPTLSRKDGQKIVLAGGIKDSVITNSLLKDVISAMNSAWPEYQLIFKPHPGEELSQPDQVRRKELLERVNILDPPRLSTNELLRSVDVSIHPSGSTATIAAAYLRLPVIHWQNEQAAERFRRITGSDEWFPASRGANLNAGSGKELEQVLHRLFFEDGTLADLRQRQERVYPALPSGNVEASVLNYIVSGVLPNRK